MSHFRQTLAGRIPVVIKNLGANNYVASFQRLVDIVADISWRNLEGITSMTLIGPELDSGMETLSDPGSS